MVVNSYINHIGKINYSEVQSLIISAYTADMAKHTSNSQSIKTISAYDSIPTQLGKDNKKFQFCSIICNIFDMKKCREPKFGPLLTWFICYLAGAKPQPNSRLSYSEISGISPRSRAGVPNRYRHPQKRRCRRP